MRKTLLVSTTAVASLLVLSACGSYGGSNAASSPAAGNIHVASTSLGKVLVDGDGHTLYRLTADSPGHSTCGSQLSGVLAGSRAGIVHQTAGREGRAGQRYCAWRSRNRDGRWLAALHLRPGQHRR